MITPNLQDKKLAEEEEEDLQSKMAQVTCSLNNREDCLACGS
jgi:hypothetical protein